MCRSSPRDIGLIPSSKLFWPMLIMFIIAMMIMIVVLVWAGCILLDSGAQL